MVLIIPFGLVTGFISVTLGYLLGHAGVKAEGVAALVAVSFIPQTWKFLWAPVADLTFTRKRWYAFSAVLCAIGLGTLGAIAPVAASLPLLSAVAFGASLATTFLAMSVESLMAYGTAHEEKGRAGGWFQAGNLGGFGVGGASAFGCLVGGYWCDRMDRKKAYWVFGLAQAACMIAMAMSPRTEAVYIGYVLLYAFISGLTYAAFSAVVLEAMGLGAAATKYNLFASLSNMPIAYMTLIDGWAHTRWGAGTMLWTEAAIGAAAVLFFMGMQLALGRPHKS